MPRLLLVTALTVATVAASARPARTRMPDVEPFLVEGRLDSGHEALSGHLDDHPDAARARYALGVVEVLQAVEQLAQSLHRYGLRPQVKNLPFVRLPVPKNPDAEELTYARFRSVLETFVADLERAAETLSAAHDAAALELPWGSFHPGMKLDIPVGRIRLDLDASGSAEEEALWRLFTTVAWRAAKLSDREKAFRIGLDSADVHWLIGYTHLLRALAEAWLAHDTEAFFEQTAPMFFAGAPESGLQGSSGRSGRFDPDRLADAIAAIHLVQFEPAEPRRLSRAREHLLAMIEQSRRCWEAARAETDDDREWIPNAEQTSLTPLEVNEARIRDWHRFLEEAEAALRGEKLLPHWRVRDGRGIDLKRVFEEPRTLDLVMWVHGRAALPYLEDGPVITADAARSLAGSFQGRFLAFAVWFQ